MHHITSHFRAWRSHHHETPSEEPNPLDKWDQTIAQDGKEFEFLQEHDFENDQESQKLLESVLLNAERRQSLLEKVGNDPEKIILLWKSSLELRMVALSLVWTQRIVPNNLEIACLRSCPNSLSGILFIHTVDRALILKYDLEPQALAVITGFVIPLQKKAIWEHIVKNGKEIEFLEVIGTRGYPSNLDMKLVIKSTDELVAKHKDDIHALAMLFKILQNEAKFNLLEQSIIPCGLLEAFKQHTDEDLDPYLEAE